MGATLISGSLFLHPPTWQRQRSKSASTSTSQVSQSHFLAMIGQSKSYDQSQTISDSFQFCYNSLLIMLCWVFTAACGLSLFVGNTSYSLLAVHRLVIVVASLGAEQGPQVHGLSSCGVQVQLPHGMWDLRSWTRD